MKKNKLLVLLLIVVLFTIGLVSLYFGSGIVSTQRYITHIKVGESVGMNADNSTTDMYFGKVPPEGTTSKTVNITNTYHKPVKTMFKRSGDMASWLSVPEPQIIRPDQTIQVSFSVTAPKDAEQGEYAGKLKILLLKT